MKVSVLFENPKLDINVETMARTCNFYGVDFYVKSLCKVGFKKSAGVLKHIPLKQLNVKDWEGRIIVTDSGYSKQPQEFYFQDGDLIVFGNESTGVSKETFEMSFDRIGIKSRGIVPCLNVSAACASIIGIILSNQPI